MRKRSNYKPKPINSNPLRKVITGLMPMTTAKDEVLTYTIKNHDALAALVAGTATPEDVYTIGHAFITAQSLAVGGLGRDWKPELDAAQEAWHLIAKRYNTWGKLQILGNELETINLGMQVFDTQVESCTIQQFEQAVARAKHAIRTKSKLSKQIVHQPRAQSIA